MTGTHTQDEAHYVEQDKGDSSRLEHVDSCRSPSRVAAGSSCVLTVGGRMMLLLLPYSCRRDASCVNSAEWSQGYKTRGPPYHSSPTLEMRPQKSLFKTHAHAQVGKQQSFPATGKSACHERGGLLGVAVVPPVNVVVGCC